MLSFFQSSRNKAEPIHLYQVVYGSGVASKIFLTDAESPIVYGGDTYRVAAIKCGEITSSGNLDKTAVEVRTVYSSPLTELFRTAAPDSVVELSILRGDANDPDAQFLRLWSGRILGFAIEGNESKFTCEPIGTATRRPGLRRNFQFGCPHFLYGPHCRANKIAATVTATVQSVTNSTVRLPNGWFGSFNPLKFQGGPIAWTDGTGNVIERTTLTVTNGLGTNTDLLLNGLPAGLAAGMQVKVSLGCNHKTDDCKLLFGNINNFGGQPYIPLKNPIGNNNNFY